MLRGPMLARDLFAIRIQINRLRSITSADDDPVDTFRGFGKIGHEADRDKGAADESKKHHLAEPVAKFFRPVRIAPDIHFLSHERPRSQHYVTGASRSRQRLAEY